MEALAENWFFVMVLLACIGVHFLHHGHGHGHGRGEDAGHPPRDHGREPGADPAAPIDPQKRR